MRLAGIVLAALGAVALAAGCGDSGGAGGTEEAIPSGSPGGVAAESSPDVSIERGATLFRRKGCMACHKLEGSRGVALGPNLSGVTERRDSAWFHHMVLEPDSMIRADPIAQALWREHGTAMPDLDLLPDQVTAIWRYLRSRDAP